MHSEGDILGATSEEWFCVHCLASILPFNHFINDNEFYYALLNQLIPLSINREYVEKLLFNPFVLDESCQFLNDEDVDPDVNFHNYITTNSSKYLIKSEFNLLMSTTFVQNNLSLILFNSKKLK